MTLFLFSSSFFAWKSLGISSKSGVAFSHLFFANDLVLFAKADYVNCMAIRDVLDAFCAQSGQSISENKSRVYFSPNVDIDSRESLYDILVSNPPQILENISVSPLSTVEPATKI